MQLRCPIRVKKWSEPEGCVCVSFRFFVTTRAEVQWWERERGRELVQLDDCFKSPPQIGLSSHCLSRILSTHLEANHRRSISQPIARSIALRSSRVANWPDYRITRSLLRLAAKGDSITRSCPRLSWVPYLIIILAIFQQFASLSSLV